MEKCTKFESSEQVPRSGLYRVNHTRHPIRDIVLLQGRTFPVCPRCLSEIEFALISAIPMESAEGRFRLLMRYAAGGANSASMRKDAKGR